MQEPIRAALSIIGILIILIACYYTTYFISRRASGQKSGKNRGGARNIAVLERFAISKDKSFCIVEVAGKIYFIGVTNQSMTLLDTLDSAEYAESAAERRNTSAAWAAPGGMPGGKLVNRLAGFMASRMGKTQGTGTQGTGKEEGAKDGTFADSMKNARDNSVSGRSDRSKAERPDGSEEE